MYFSISFVWKCNSIDFKGCKSKENEVQEKRKKQAVGFIQKAKFGGKSGREKNIEEDILKKEQKRGKTNDMLNLMR